MCSMLLFIGFVITYARTCHASVIPEVVSARMQITIFQLPKYSPVLALEFAVFGDSI